MRSCLSITRNKPFKVLLAPNDFKGSLSAMDFCRILSEELESAEVCPVSLPMCDGGDGTAAVLASYLHATPHTCSGVDALGRPHMVNYYTAGNSAILDLAEVCGLKYLRPEEYDVMNAHTGGLGQVLKEIVGRGFRKIILGVGGSASIDGGTGALEEMGMKIIKNGSCYRNHLIEMESINMGELIDYCKEVEWLVLCDVNNPLCGTEGAATIFGPQKGASPLQVAMLDSKLQYYASLLAPFSPEDPLHLTGGGAAGGVAAAFHALLGARLVSGAEYCLQLSGFHRLLGEAQLVITGEGKLDGQSLCGKLPGKITELCRQYSVPLVAIAGLADAPLPDFKHVYTFSDYTDDLSDSIRHPERYLRLLARNLRKDFQI